MDILSIPPPHINTYFLSVAETVPCRTESNTPSTYRLAKKLDGTLVLQGGYRWTEGWSNHGITWKDLPTIELSE